MRWSWSLFVHGVMPVALTIFSTLSLSCVAQQPEQVSSRNEVLRKFLRDYVGASTPEREATRYSSAFVDLRDNGEQEAIVYLSSDGWCGTGGCTLLILAPESTSYRVVTKIPAVRLPIRMLTSKNKGWHDVTVVAGKPLQEQVLPFDGKTYPRNASMLPAYPLTREAKGKIVMPETAVDKPLYQDTANSKNGNLRPANPGGLP